MWHLGIDLGRRSLWLAGLHEDGRQWQPKEFVCQNPGKLLETVQKLGTFRVVIEASETYRWLYELLCPFGEVLLAHPLKLRALVQRRSKTDKLDSLLLAKLLRLDMIPFAHIPAKSYQRLREITRYRARLVQLQVQSKNGLRALLARHNRGAPYKKIYGPLGRRWLGQQDFGEVDNAMRDEMLDRFSHYEKQIKAINQRLEALRPDYPQVEPLIEMYGMGLYSALLIIGELGHVFRFRHARQVGAYCGLSARVYQSGSTCHYGHISKQGSVWLRWILVEIAMKVIKKDRKLGNFYERVRKRSNKKVARVAVARKLAEICWKRLVGWHLEEEQKLAA